MDVAACRGNLRQAGASRGQPPPVLRLGFVINFNVPHLKEGIRRIVLCPLVSFVVNGKRLKQTDILNMAVGIAPNCVGRCVLLGPETHLQEKDADGHRKPNL